jgi:hypothetical protein
VAWIYSGAKLRTLATLLKQTPTTVFVAVPIAGNQYLAVAHATTRFVTIYERNSDSFAKIPDPDTLPTGNAVSACFSVDGNYLAIAHSVSPYVTIYKRSGDVFSKIS